MLDSGSQVQNAIYLAGGSGWPIAPEDWEARAREQLEQGPFDYVAGGAGSEATIRANREAFERRRLRPRMLTGYAERDLSVEVLGLRSPVPFLLGPVGVLSILHPEVHPRMTLRLPRCWPSRPFRTSPSPGATSSGCAPARRCRSS